MRDVAVISFAQTKHARSISDINEVEMLMPILGEALEGKNIPYLARIAAVADAYDAMASDRPYRPGMADDKLDAIIRAGAGKQWDAEVVDAFFRVRDDIRQISQGPGDLGDFSSLQFT